MLFKGWKGWKQCQLKNFYFSGARICLYCVCACCRVNCRRRNPRTFWPGIYFYQ